MPVNAGRFGFVLSGGFQRSAISDQLSACWWLIADCLPGRRSKKRSTPIIRFVWRRRFVAIGQHFRFWSTPEFELGGYVLFKERYPQYTTISRERAGGFCLYFVSVHFEHKKFEKIKFGKILRDGTLQSPTPLKLKFLLPYYFKLNEKQTVWLLYGITTVFCVIALVLGV